MLINQLRPKLKTYISIIYISLSISATALLLYSFANPEIIRQSRNYTFFIVVISVAFINLFPKGYFALATLISYPFRPLGNLKGQLIWLYGSFLISLGIFLVILHGIFVGRYNLDIKEHELYFSDLPIQLDGLKVVQLSDFHLGSFAKNVHNLDRSVKIIQQIEPDVLLFTGDLVNNFSDELAGYEPYLKKLTARYGKLAIQGNHDYGDYSQWRDSTSKLQNLELIRNGLTNAGFDLLLNRWTKVQIRDTSICIIGVENWGHKPFPQYARLDMALDSIPINYFKILMTHDPEHWKAKVVPETDIPLTLSGHTHGGQFALKIAGVEFSPIYFYQKLWGGLYQSDNQYLYVNRGLGTIGFPGRIEMRPEITILTLRRAKSH
ncbi:MAG: metallophosphoesterase [Prolixibacteraceae bacterium]|nr:metallophosphoesterase [Prolixibacteraceae bacterium]